MYFYNTLRFNARDLSQRALSLARGKYDRLFRKLPGKNEGIERQAMQTMQAR